MLLCADGNNSAIVIQRICQRIAGLKLKLGKDVFTLSYAAGITQLDDQAKLDFPAMLNQVNEALVRAQAAGENQISLYQTRAVQPSADKQPDVPLDRLLKKLEQDAAAVTRHELLQGMLRIMPMLQQANIQLNLGIEDAIALVQKEL